MNILNGYILVEALPKEKKEGFDVVETQDNFVYKGKVVGVSDIKPTNTISSTYIPNDSEIKVGDVVLFAKYSPDTHEIDLDGRKVKFVKVTDVLATE